jgi:hypothetical protein
MTSAYDHLNFDDVEAPVLKAVEGDAATINASIQAVLGDVGERPVVDFPSDTEVLLPGGLLRDGVTFREAEVRELTGEDEEALSRAQGNNLRFVGTLLRQGVVSIGGDRVTNEVLKELLIGDRDALVLGIRRATFGNDLDFKDLICPGCNAKLDVTVHLDEVPIRKLDNPLIREFTVELSRGASAVVRLPNGGDQEAIFADPELTSAEQNTILLSRVVQTITDRTGRETKVRNNPLPVRSLGVADRKRILTFLDEHVPGPAYNEVTFKHEECGKETPLSLTVGDLFLDL